MNNVASSARNHLIETALEGGNIGHWVWYIAENRFDYADTCPESLEYQPQDFTCTLEGFGALIHPQDIAPLTAAFIAGDQANSRYTADIRMLNGQGIYKHMRISGKVVTRDQDGAALIASGTIENITKEREQGDIRRRLLDGMPICVGLLDTECRLVEANSAAIHFFNLARENLIGRCIWDLPGWPVDTENIKRIRAGVDSALAGEADNFEIAWHDTEMARQSIDMRIAPLYNSHAMIIGCILSGTDITARKEMEQQEALLMRELQHRVKNTLAVVQGLASQILRQAVSKEDAAQTLSEQLQALASAHDMLVENNWSETSIQDIVGRLQNEHAFSQGAITAQGPPVKFSQKSTVMLTLALHELRANSIKYGALSTEGGRVDIHWETRHQGQNGFHLKWVETGVSIQELPRSKGFGSVLLLKIFPAEFQGVATFDYTPGQLTYSMRGTLSAT